MKAIIQKGSNKVKYLFNDNVAVNITPEQVEVRNPMLNFDNREEFDLENFDIGDLNESTCVLVENFPETPVDFAPDKFCYDGVNFTPNVDHPVNRAKV